MGDQKYERANRALAGRAIPGFLLELHRISTGDIIEIQRVMEQYGIA